MKTKTIITIASSLLIASLPAFAGSTMTSPDSNVITTTDSDWNVRTALYGWFTAMDGDITVRGNTAPVDVDFSDIIDKIDFAFMGVVEVGRGDWSFAADLFYAKLGADNTVGPLSFDVDMEQFIGNFVVVRNLVNDGTTRFDVYGGARVSYLSNDLFIDRTLVLAPDIDVSASKTWVDPIIGLRVNHNLSEKLFLRGVADIGGFGIESDLTWQAYVALGYRLSDRSALSIGYRGLGTDFTDGAFTYDVISHGLILGFEYKF
jgi:opacity protein-like surface antigen